MGTTCSSQREAPIGGPRALPCPAEDGFSLVEAIVAIFVIGVALSGLAYVMMGGLSSLSQSAARQEAYTLATRSLELVRGYQWDAVAVRDGDPQVVGVSSFDHLAGTVSAPGSREPVVVTPAGEVTGPDHQRGDPDDPVRLRTYVTEPGDPDLKRVTAVVEVQRGGRVERVRQTTLLSQARWGIEQPSFSLMPTGETLVLERATEVCRPITITNRGSTDTYRVTAPSAALLPVDQVQAFHQYLPPRLLLGATGSTVLTSGSTVGPLANGQTVTVRVCLTPRADADASLAALSDLPVVVESTINPATSQSVLYDLDVELERTLFLRSFGEQVRDPSVPYPLSGAAEPLAEGALETLDLTHATAGAGLLLPVAPDAGAEARWRLQFNEVRTVRQADVRLYTASTVDALAPTETEPDPPPPSGTYRVELRRLDADGTLLGTLASQLVTYPQSSTFQARDLAMAVTPQTFEPQDRLELAVTCEPASTDPCRLALSTVEFPAHIRLGFQGPRP